MQLDLTFTNIANEVMAAFGSRLNLLTRFSRRFTTETSESSSLDVSLVSAGLAPINRTTEDLDDASIIGNAQDSKVSVAINLQAVNGISLRMAEINQSKPEVLSAHLKQKLALKANAIAYTVLQSIYGVVTPSNFPSNAITADAAAYDLAKIAEDAVALREAGFPIPGTVGVLSGGHYAAVTSDPALAGLVQAGLITFAENGAEMTTKDAIPLLHAANLPTANNLVGFYAAPDAMAVGMRPSARLPEGIELPDGVELQVLQDDASGVVMSYYKFFQPSKQRWVINFICDYGVAKGNASALRRIVKA